MKTEKVVLSFIAVLIGLFASGIAFYLYQSTKTIPQSEIKTISLVSPTPKNEKSNVFLTLNKPKDEEVVSEKTITISGKTTPTATVVIVSEYTEQVITPAKNGDFSTTITLQDKQNYIEIAAIDPSGDEVTVSRTVTYSTESF